MPYHAGRLPVREIFYHIGTAFARRKVFAHNSWNLTVKRLPIEKIKNLPFPFDKSVMLYDERRKMLYGTTIKDVIDFVQSFEPWDEVDAYIFRIVADNFRFSD